MGQEIVLWNFPPTRPGTAPEIAGRGLSDPPGLYHGQVVIICGLAKAQLLLLIFTHALQHAVEHMVVSFIWGLEIGHKRQEYATKKLKAR